MTVLEPATVLLVVVLVPATVVVAARWLLFPHPQPPTVLLLVLVPATLFVSEADATEALLHLHGIINQLQKSV